MSGSYETFFYEFHKHNCGQGNMMVENKVNWGGLCCTRPMPDPHSLPYEEQELHFPHLYKETTQKTTNAM